MLKFNDILNMQKKSFQFSTQAKADQDGYEKSNKKRLPYIKNKNIFPKLDSPIKNKLINKKIDELKEIRIIVRNGGGLGNQKAAITLMQRLRELGFIGTFDVRYLPYCADRLEILIPGFKADEEKTIEIEASDLGKLKLTSLGDNDDEKYNLPPTLITIIGADDFGHFFQDEKCKQYNTEYYITAKPTDFHLGNYSIASSHNKKIIDLYEFNPRLSSTFSCRDRLNETNLNSNEKIVLEIIRSNKTISQLIYGIHPKHQYDPFLRKNVSTGSIGEKNILERLIKIESDVARQFNKPLLLLIPQKITEDDSFVMELKEQNKQFYFYNLTNQTIDFGNHHHGDTIIAYTGVLSPKIFDEILLSPNLLPPIIEGCNSRETCESYGREFLSPHHIKTYNVIEKEVQEMHMNACLYITLDNISDQHYNAFKTYIDSYLSSEKTKISIYHQQRKEKFLERPNICDLALSCIGIMCENVDKNIFNIAKKFNSNLAEVKSTALQIRSPRHVAISVNKFNFSFFNHPNFNFLLKLNRAEIEETITQSTQLSSRWFRS